MKKIVYALVLASFMVFMVPLSTYAAHPGVHGSVNIAVGHPGWRGHNVAWHGHYGHYGHYRGWGPRFYWGGSVVLGPWWYPWYPYPYGYYPPPQSYVQSPPVYVAPQQPQQNYWYYCQDPQGYYPYVKNCPGGWMKVVPQQAPQQAPPTQ